MLRVGHNEGTIVGSGVGLGGSVNVTVPVIVFETQSIFVIRILSVTFNVIIEDSLFLIADS